MLDVITDFWKPVRKGVSQGKADLSRLQQGSALSFGTVPQALLSGRQFTVTTVSTYQFGDERMTSYFLSGDQEDANVSLIVANAEGEQYLALSRRISFSDRMRMFDPAELEAVAEQPEALKLTCREIDVNWRHWVVAHYKKEISGVRGANIKGDFRNQPLPENAGAQPFDYMLLTSDSNEYAIEIERYLDGRLEVYATIYRRVSDIVEIENPQAAEPRLSAPVLEVVKPEPKLEFVAEPAEESTKEIPAAIIAAEAAAPAPAVQELPIETPSAAEAAPVVFVSPVISDLSPQQPIMENDLMQTNGALKEQEKQVSYGAAAGIRQELSKSGAENDAIECELRVANKIIEEAIRNEMRLSDVVRRIIALPVANPESVQIPITLSDSDFQLLAIRYGVPAADRNAIKSRIIEEMNDFSGSKKQ